MPFLFLDLNMPRYKIAVQTVLSQNGGQGIRVSSKSLWDVQNDNWASSSYANVRFPLNQLVTQYAIFLFRPLCLLWVWCLDAILNKRLF